MKKIFTILAVLSLAITPAMAQRSVAALSHKGNLTFFDNHNSLGNAISNAVNGDTIFLSAGEFVSSDTEITLSKRIAIIGCGYDSYIAPKISVRMDNNPDSYMDVPMFEGVYLRNLTFYQSENSANNLKEVKINKCKIKNMYYCGYAGRKLLIDRCDIGWASFNGSDNICTVDIQNSKIEGMGDYTEHVSVTNCNIKGTHYLPLRVISSIIASANYKDGYGNPQFYARGSHLVRNSLLPKGWVCNKVSSNSSVSTENNYEEKITEDNPVLDENLECTLNLQEKGYLGEDGTVIGIYGGFTPYTKIPSVPTVDAANSSVEYDKENNKLNVKITVTPN